jgi:hypothetical protein
MKKKLIFIVAILVKKKLIFGLKLVNLKTKKGDKYFQKLISN